jgi:glyoxalase family protein
VRLEGIHHVTAITGEAQQNVDFYAGTLGLRLVKKTVNQDDPTVYHLFYADEKGSAGSDITFFEYPHAKRGRAGAGMVHRVVWRVGSEESLAFWADRLGVARDGATVRFADPEGLEHELVVDESGDEPLTAEHPEIPEEHRLRGFAGARAFADDPERSRPLLEETLGFEPGYEARGERRGGFYVYDAPPAGPGIGGAGTVHHVAWASPPDDHEAWHSAIYKAGLHVTPVIDRFYFRSIYFREPSGVLFEIATLGPGFATDEPADRLGERLSLPPAFEHLRERIEPVLTPIRNPREEWARR